MMNLSENVFGLYVHWPFCQSKCPYCDFNSHVSAWTDQNRWKAAFLSEIDRLARDLPGRRLTSVFFGGGTPSLMEPDLVAAILDRIRGAWPVANDWEVTLEANPGSVDAGRFRGYREAGVNRISMGIQALSNTDLRRLGRLHTVGEARAAFDVARNLFDRVSFDLIYARQDQSLAQWEAELREALAMAIDHISLYQLTIEDGTAFADRFRRGGLRGLPIEELSADMFTRTREICADLGFPAYEVSSHARSGAESQHNLIYWCGGDYAGIGPGAHGRITRNGLREATVALRQPGAWLAAVAQKGSGQEVPTVLSAQETIEERVIMGMRLTEGVAVSALQGHVSQRRIDALEGDGLMWQTDERIGATEQGFLLLNHVIRQLLTD